jgi:hypothetical protein
VKLSVKFSVTLLTAALLAACGSAGDVATTPTDPGGSDVTRPAPPTTRPSTTAPPTTVPATTAAPTTAPPATVPPTTALPSLAPGTDGDFAVTLATSASASEIWDVWTDVEGWPRWDVVTAATLDGPFALGATGSVTNPDGSTAAFEVTAFEDGRSYELTFPLPDAELTIERTLDAGLPVTFTHRVRIEGPGAAPFAELLGPTFRAALPGAMDAIRRLAEAA